MKTKVCRIEPDAIIILSKHSDGKGTISEQVRVMDKMIREMKPNESGDTKSNWIPGANLVDSMPPEYWKRLTQELDKVIKEYAGR